MNKIDKEKLNKVSGGLNYNPGGNISDPGIQGNNECKQAFNKLSCSGCFFCEYSNQQNPNIANFTCKKGYYGTIKYDLTKNKVVE